MRIGYEDARVDWSGSRESKFGRSFAEQEVDAAGETVDGAPPVASFVAVPMPVFFFVVVAGMVDHGPPLGAVGGCVDPVGDGEAGFESDLLKGAAGSSRGRRVVGVTARGLRHPLPTDEVAERLIVP